MAELIWIFMWIGIAGVGSIVMWAATKYFIFKEPKEEVIADIKDLIKGEELD